MWDLGHGLMRRYENTLKSPKQDERSTVTLKGVETIPVEEAEQLARQAEMYFAAVTKYASISEHAADDMANFDAQMVSASQVLEKAQASLTDEAFRDHIAEMIEVHPRRINYHRGRADRRNAVIGQPAPEWSLLDLDGVTHTLAEYRGKVVILDFWYRRCTWCGRSMPQLREIGGLPRLASASSTMPLTMIAPAELSVLDSVPSPRKPIF